MSDIFEKIRNLHSNIANDTWPDGWDMECPKCGKTYHMTKEQCAWSLAHGWPECCPDCERGKANE